MKPPTTTLWPALLGVLGAACAATAGVESPVAPARSVAVDDLDARLARLTESLEEQRETLHVPGLALAIVKDDELVYARGFGVADVEAGTPVTPETLFAIGSSTKAFTTTLIGMLIDEGVMSWDDRVTTHLPDFELAIDGEGVVTIADLLSHQTGFTRMGVLWGAGTTDRATILATATRAEPWSPFREAFFYNNVMYLAAGEASAAAHGGDDVTWDDLIHERIFAPLGMTSSSTSITVAQRDPRLSLGYLWDEDEEVYERLPMRNLDAIAPAGAINSNVLDMARWLRLLLGRGTFEGSELVSADRVHETWTPRIELGGGQSYGLGWFLGEWNGQPEVEHGGNIDGFGAQVALLPESNLGFVLLTNVTATPLQATSRQLVWDALLGAPDELADEAAPAESLEDYLGVFVANYAHFQDEPFEVLIQNDRLAIDIPSQMAFELQPPDDDGWRPFAVAPAQIQARFVRDDQGDANVLELRQNELVFEIPREGTQLPGYGSQEEFTALYGTYSHPKLPQPFEVRYEGGRVVCDVPGQMVFALDPPAPGEDVWLFRASDRLGLEFHPDEAGEVPTLTFHERGSETLCTRVGDGAVELIDVDGLMALRDADAVAARLDALGTLRLTGTLRFVHSGISGTTATTFAGDGRFHDDTRFEPFGWATGGYDGETGWSVSAFRPFDEVEGKYLDQLRLSHPAVFFGDWRRHFDSVAVLRASDLDDRRCWVARLKKGELPAWTAWVDAETGDVVRVDAAQLAPGLGSIPETTLLSEHREVHGLRLPHRVVTESVASGRIEVVFERVEVLDDVPDALFAPPADADGQDG